MSRRRDAYRLAFAGGVLLLVTGATGSAALYVLALGFAASVFPDFAQLATGLAVAFALLASAGGATVLLGAHLLRKGARLPGKLVVEIGAGAGLLGLLLRLARASAEGGFDAALAALLTLDGLGLALTVAATIRAG